MHSTKKELCSPITIGIHEVHLQSFKLTICLIYIRSHPFTNASHLKINSDIAGRLIPRKQIST